MNPELSLDLFIGAASIGFVLIVLNLFRVLSPRSFVDIFWSWVTVVLSLGGWWFGPYNAMSLLVLMCVLLYAGLVWLRTYYYLQSRSESRGS